MMPDFYVLKIQWDDEQGDIKGVFRTEKDCWAVVAKYNGWSSVTVTKNGFDEPQGF